MNKNGVFYLKESVGNQEKNGRRTERPPLTPAESHLLSIVVLDEHVLRVEEDSLARTLRGGNAGHINHNLNIGYFYQFLFNFTRLQSPTAIHK